MALNINKFLVGNQSFKNETERKQCILLGQLSFLGASIFLFYLIADPLNGLYSFIHWYIIGIIGSIIVVFINRQGHYKTGASILLITATLILFVVAFIGNPNRGVYFYFIAAAVSSMVFFYNRSVTHAFTFIAINFAAVMVAYLVESPIQEIVPTSKEAIQFRFMLNYILATLTAVVGILFMILRNTETEKSLRNSNDQLSEIKTNLELSNTRFERAVNASKAGIYEWNIITGEIYVSNRWRQLLGIDNDPDLVIDIDFFLSLVHADDAERTSNNISSLLASGGHYQNEVRMRKADGSYNWFLDAGLVEFDNGRASIASGSITNINDRKKAEESIIHKNKELQKANNELDRFVYSASHDMRAPLSTLLGLIEIVKLSEDPKEYKKYFEMMIRRIHDMEGFISDVTDYSRNTRLEVNNLPINLCTLLKQLEETYHTLAEQAHVTLKFEVDPEIIIYSDETRLKVVLGNLIANAIKYNNAKAERYVKVTAKSEKNTCYIVIADNGRGIAAEFQPKIFNMFYRATDDSAGSGLGLYIVNETLEKLGGEISFESEVRKGSTFTVSIPQVS